MISIGLVIQLRAILVPLSSQNRRLELLERHSILSDWITLVFLGCILLMTSAKFLFPKRFDEFIYLPLNNKYFLLQGKSDTLTHVFNLLLFVVQLLSVSFFIYLLLTEVGYGTDEKLWLLYIQICAIYFVFIGVKIFIEKIIGNVFNMEGLINQYLYQKLTYRNYIAIFLLFCNILLMYTLGANQTILLFILSLAVAFNGIGLILSYKNFRNVLAPQILYFILYLCALEIAPYVILYKAVT
ncbi:MAG: hypothetical protein ACI836_000583 [Saprospiraceae bacterium]|jgi:hypothetical protein